MRKTPWHIVELPALAGVIVVVTLLAVAACARGQRIDAYRADIGVQAPPAAPVEPAAETVPSGS